jgi:hypothetical protein
MAIQDELFQRLFDVLQEHELLLKRLADNIDRLELGKGMATLTDYESNHEYKRNSLVVDRVTETVYRVTPRNGTSYTSITVEQDCSDGNLKLVGFESQIVPFDHEPTQYEINTVPDGAMVAIYSPSDTPYRPASQE